MMSGPRPVVVAVIGADTMKPVEPSKAATDRTAPASTVVPGDVFRTM
jgi:hypothetical protein